MSRDDTERCAHCGDIHNPDVMYYYECTGDTLCEHCARTLHPDNNGCDVKFHHGWDGQETPCPNRVALNTQEMK